METELQISQRGIEMPASPIRKLAPLAYAAEDRGVKIYRLNIGQPDLPTPQKALDVLIHFLKNLLAYFRNMGEVDLNTEVNTESNLGFKVMNVILNGLNLTLIEDHIDHDAYSLKEDMDKFLLDKRNGLVHGDPASTVTTEQVTKAITLVERLMNLTKETILNGYKNEVFKAERSTITMYETLSHR